MSPASLPLSNFVASSRITRGLIKLTAALALLAEPGALAQSTAPADYIIGPRDLLAVTVFGEPSVSGSFRVENDGGFTYPLLGRVALGGLTLRQAEDQLRTKLRDGFFRDPQVSVAVQEYGSQKIFVVGEVRDPGSFPLTGETTLIAALALAGGLTPSAGAEIQVVRPASGVGGSGPLLPNQDGASVLVRADLQDVQSGATAQTIRLQNGDTIYVPRAEMIFVSGQVRNAGAFPLQKDLTVLQAIALAGGVTDRGSTSRIKIVRRIDGVQHELKAKATDPVQPGDTIIVLERFF